LSLFLIQIVALQDQYEAGLPDLHGRVQRGTSSGYSNSYADGTLASLAYRALPSRRQSIPKPDGRMRPLGVTALEDKIVQRAVVAVLNAIYETDFAGFSYGFHPKRSQHDALDALAVGLHRRKVWAGCWTPISGRSSTRSAMTG
jgi:hypothetical protein